MLEGIIFNGFSVFLSLSSYDYLASLPADAVQLFVTIAGAFILLCTLLIIFLMKRKRMTRELKFKTEEIERANRNLQQLNLELIEQKDNMARELANSEMLYSIMLASADDGIVFYNNDWSVKYVNPAIYSIIGLDQKDKTAPDIINNEGFLHPDDADFHEKRSEAIAGKGFYEAEIKVRHKSGKYIFLSTKLVEVKDGSGIPLGILSISRDISSLKNTQNQLIIAKEKAEESNRLKSTFLANISHEIRTPLNSIVGFANLLDDVSSNPEMREEYVSYLNQNTEKLLQIITDIIDLSRLENDEIDISYNPVKINSVLDFTAEYATGLIRNSGKEIKFSIDKGLKDGMDIIYSDDMWLKRIFRHLVDNAVKFTRAGHIELSSAMAGSSVMFSIKDTGIGISRKNLQSIFEQFRQEEDSHHRSFEGLGVGLTTARKVVENMDGYLWVESEKGKGSEFFFTIPYRPVDVSSYEELEKTEGNIILNQDWNGKTILVADDNIDILRYLNHVLSDTGINVIQARSGLEALDIIKSKDVIDLVLMDMQMPEMNGLEALTEIRKLKGNIPVVAQTAFILEKEENELINAGCDACLIKPISQDQLLTVISGFLKNSDHYVS